MLNSGRLLAQLKSNGNGEADKPATYDDYFLEVNRVSDINTKDEIR